MSSERHPGRERTKDTGAVEPTAAPSGWDVGEKKKKEKIWTASMKSECSRVQRAFR